MKMCFRGLPAATAMALLFQMQASAQASRGLVEMGSRTNQRFAVCIGVNHYADTKLTPLKKAANDAYGLASVLESNGGFKTYVFSDLDEKGAEKPISARMIPSRRQIEEFLQNAVAFKDIKKDDLVVFSFSGHGISDAGKSGYLLPLDWNSAEPFQSAIPVSAITAWLKKLGVTKSLLLIDACREEMTAGRSVDAFSRLYEEKFLTANVSAAFYATRQGGFSYDDPDSKYGAFTRFLIDGLNGAANRDGDEVVTFRELASFVEEGLGNWALRNGFKQRPYTRIFDEQSGDLALTVATPNRISARENPAPAYPQLVEPKPAKPSYAFITTLGIKMLKIPGGTFKMGPVFGDDSKTTGGTVNDGGDRPFLPVTVPAFEMSATEVTVGQFRVFVRETGYRTDAERTGGAFVWVNGEWVKKADASWKKPYSELKDDNPVVCVSWNDANAFCKWLIGKTGRKFGLPTEGEWEYACRAGTDMLLYSNESGNDLERTGRRFDKSGDSVLSSISLDAKLMSDANCLIKPVGQKVSNMWGLFDMSGNAWEWCTDRYGNHSGGSFLNISRPLSDTTGGDQKNDWQYIAGFCRSALRAGIDPAYRNGYLGFRIVLRP